MSSKKKAAKVSKKSAAKTRLPWTPKELKYFDQGKKDKEIAELTGRTQGSVSVKRSSHNRSKGIPSKRAPTKVASKTVRSIKPPKRLIQRWTEEQLGMFESHSDKAIAKLTKRSIGAVAHKRSVLNKHEVLTSASSTLDPRKPFVRVNASKVGSGISRVIPKEVIPTQHVVKESNYFTASINGAILNVDTSMYSKLSVDDTGIHLEK